jgi:hypothetical protein
MSLDVYLNGAPCEHCGRGGEGIFEANITHNLGAMADAAGIYKALWRPDEIGITTAAQLVAPLTVGATWLKANETEARKHDAPNGWGMYEHFVPFVEKYLAACVENPTALVSVSR